MPRNHTVANMAKFAALGQSWLRTAVTNQAALPANNNMIPTIGSRLKLTTIAPANMMLKQIHLIRRKSQQMCKGSKTRVVMSKYGIGEFPEQLPHVPSPNSQISYFQSNVKVNLNSPLTNHRTICTIFVHLWLYVNLYWDLLDQGYLKITTFFSWS